MEYGTRSLGLENSTGSNNCFLNVVMQSFWHIPSFRSYFQVTSFHHEHENSGLCLICEIKVI